MFTKDLVATVATRIRPSLQAAQFNISLGPGRAFHQNYLTCSWTAIYPRHEAGIVRWASSELRISVPASEDLAQKGVPWAATPGASDRGKTEGINKDVRYELLTIYELARPTREADVVL
jgi:hypothetical protein